jgi:hypothetical protein
MAVVVSEVWPLDYLTERSSHRRRKLGTKLGPAEAVSLSTLSTPQLRAALNCSGLLLWVRAADRAAGATRKLELPAS